MKKILTIILSMTLLFSAMSAIAYASDSYTIRQYVKDYYHDIYGENDMAFSKISMTNTKTADKILQLSNDVLQNELFSAQIDKVNESYVVQTAERYYITFQSASNNILYLCITEKGEVFFGRYADYNKPNYCEYLVKDTTNVIKSLSELYSSDIASNKFNDISGHWAESTINKWKDKGIISGYPDGTFKPDNSVTRAELAKILTLAFDLQEKTAINYDDVKAENWYYSYLESSAKYIPIYPLPISYETNIPYVEVSDKGLNYFLPETPAMRMHVAEALVKIKKDKEKINIELPSIQDIQADVTAAFKDDDYENLYAMHGTIPENVKRMLEYTYLANKLGIMQGDSNGYFHPYDSVTRAELITMLDRMTSTAD